MARAKAAVYVRTSTKTNELKTGKQRALKMGQIAAKQNKHRIAKVVHEVISGTKPVEDRPQLAKLLSVGDKKNKINAIYVESARDIARSPAVGEQVYNMARKEGIHIVVLDQPRLLAPEQNPSEEFSRIVTWALCQKERREIRERLEKGLALKLSSSKRVSQSGRRKVNGNKSTLERLGEKLTKKKRAELTKIFKDRQAGRIKWKDCPGMIWKCIRKRVSMMGAYRMAKELSVNKR
jgi:DNA invertase Pin-like site-specific DNA recombinase